MTVGIDDLPEKYDDLPNKRQYWPAAAGSPEEGLGMLRILTPEIVADAARTQIQTGLRVCLNWDLEQLNPPGRTITGINHGESYVVAEMRSNSLLGAVH